MANYESHKIHTSSIGSSLAGESLTTIKKVDLHKGLVFYLPEVTNSFPKGYRGSAKYWAELVDSIMEYKPSSQKYNTTYIDRPGMVAGIINSTPEHRMLPIFDIKKPFYLPKRKGDGPFTIQSVPAGYDIVPTKILKPKLVRTILELPLGGVDTPTEVDVIDYLADDKSKQTPSSVMVFNVFPPDEETQKHYGKALDILIAHDTPERKYQAVLSELMDATKNFSFSGGTLLGFIMRLRKGRNITHGGHLDTVLPDGLPADKGEKLESIKVDVLESGIYCTGSIIKVSDGETTKELYFKGNIFEKFGRVTVEGENLYKCSPQYPSTKDRILAVPNFFELSNVYPLTVDITKVLLENEPSGLAGNNPFNPVNYGDPDSLLSCLKWNKKAASGLPFLGTKDDAKFSNLVLINELLGDLNSIYLKYDQNLLDPRAIAEIERDIFSDKKYRILLVSIMMNKTEVTTREKIFKKTRCFWEWPTVNFMLWAMFVLPLEPKNVADDEGDSPYCMKGMALTSRGFEKFIYAGLKNSYKPRVFNFSDNLYIIWKGLIFSFDLVQAECQHNTALLKAMIDYYISCIESVTPMNKFYRDMIRVVMPFLFENCRGLMGPNQIPVDSLPSGTAMTAELNHFATACFVAILEKDERWLSINGSTSKQELLEIFSDVCRENKLWFTLEAEGNILEETSSSVVIKSDLLGMNIVKFADEEVVYSRIMEALDVCSILGLEDWIGKNIAPGQTFAELEEMLQSQKDRLGHVYLLELDYETRMLPGLVYKDQSFLKSTRKLEELDQETLTEDEYVLKRLSHIASYILNGLWLHPVQFALALYYVKMLLNRVSDMDLIRESNFVSELDNTRYPIMKCLHPIFAAKVFLRERTIKLSNLSDSSPVGSPSADYEPVKIASFRVREKAGKKEFAPSLSIEDLKKNNKIMWADIHDMESSFASRNYSKVQLPAEILNSKKVMPLMLTQLGLKGSKRSEVGKHLIDYLKSHGMIPRKFVMSWYYKYKNLDGLDKAFVKEYLIDHPNLSKITFKDSNELYNFTKDYIRQLPPGSTYTPSKEYVELSALQTKANYLAWKERKYGQKTQEKQVKFSAEAYERTKPKIKLESKKKQEMDKTFAEAVLSQPGSSKVHEAVSVPLVIENKVAGKTFAKVGKKKFKPKPKAETFSTEDFKDMVKQLNKYGIIPKLTDKPEDLKIILDSKIIDDIESSTKYLLNFAFDPKRRSNVIKVYLEKKDIMPDVNLDVIRTALAKAKILDADFNVIEETDKYPGT